MKASLRSKNDFVVKSFLSDRFRKTKNNRLIAFKLLVVSSIIQQSPSRHCEMKRSHHYSHPTWTVFVFGLSTILTCNSFFTDSFIIERVVEKYSNWNKETA